MIAVSNTFEYCSKGLQKYVCMLFAKTYYLCTSTLSYPFLIIMKMLTFSIYKRGNREYLLNKFQFLRADCSFTGVKKFALFVPSTDVMMLD